MYPLQDVQSDCRQAAPLPTPLRYALITLIRVLRKGRSAVVGFFVSAL